MVVGVGHSSSPQADLPGVTASLTGADKKATATPLGQVHTGFYENGKVPYTGEKGRAGGVIFGLRSEGLKTLPGLPGEPSAPRRTAT
jgi:hypothetical protein